MEVLEGLGSTWRSQYQQKTQLVDLLTLTYFFSQNLFIHIYVENLLFEVLLTTV